MLSRKHILFEDVEEGLEWVVVYNLGVDEFDDSVEDIKTVEIVLNAMNIDTAVRYAQQYLRKMQSEEDTAEQWVDAEIISVELH